MVKIGISNFPYESGNDEVVLFLGDEFSVAAFPEKTAFVAEISITNGFNLGNAAGVISKFVILRFDIRYSSPLRPRQMPYPRSYVWVKARLPLEWVFPLIKIYISYMLLNPAYEA